MKLNELRFGDNLRVVQPDDHKYGSFAKSILDLDSRILACIIVKTPDGAILAEEVKPEFRSSLGSLTQLTNGMIGTWSILAFSIMGRLEKARSKMNYLAFGRENDKGNVTSSEHIRRHHDRAND